MGTSALVKKMERDYPMVFMTILASLFKKSWRENVYFGKLEAEKV